MRRWPVAVLALFAAVLSFDALRAHALDTGVIPDQAILPRAWLAAMWALTIDVAVAAGLMRIRDDGDWRAWLMLGLALAATLGFQAVSPERAVPPVALALAVLVLEAPRRKPTAPTPGPVGEPTAPEAERTPAVWPMGQPPAPPAPAHDDAAPDGVLDPAHAAAIAELAAEGAGERAILPALAGRGIEVPRAAVREELRRLRASRNGDHP